MKLVNRVNAVGVAQKLRTDAGSDSDADSGQTHDDTVTPSPAEPSLSADLIARFEALIEEVTQELMQSRCNDQNTCRADAIALLLAASEQFENPAQRPESPLKYMLLEEQSRSRALLGEAARTGPMQTLMRV
jgi:hypothetical protein